MLSLRGALFTSSESDLRPIQLRRRKIDLVIRRVERSALPKCPRESYHLD
jgi:hypothetical protein